MENYTISKNEQPNIISCKSYEIWSTLNEWRCKYYKELRSVTMNVDRKLFTAFCTAMLECGIVTLKYEDDYLEIGLLEHTDLEKWATNKIVMNISVFCKN